MDPVTRRSFLVTSSAGALGVAGAAAIGVQLASPAAADDPEPAADQLAGLDDPAVLQVRDAGSGEVELLVADRSIVFNDKRLVARLLRATR
jgi:hypothetical protein